MSMGSSTFSTEGWDRDPRGPGPAARCRPHPGRTGAGRLAAGRGRGTMRRGGATLRDRGPTDGGRPGREGWHRRERAPGPDAPADRAGRPDGSPRRCARGGGGRGGPPRLHLRSEHDRRCHHGDPGRAPVVSPPAEQPLQCSGRAPARPHRGGVGHSRRFRAGAPRPTRAGASVRDQAAPGESGPMSIFQPVSFAARRAFWPSLPMARENWFSGTRARTSLPTSSTTVTEVTRAGERALAT